MDIVPFSGNMASLPHLTIWVNLNSMQMEALGKLFHAQKHYAWQDLLELGHRLLM